MENESGQHLGDELLGADDDDVVEGVPDIRSESAANSEPQAQKNTPSAKEGNLDRNSIVLQNRYKWYFLFSESCLNGCDDDKALHFGQMSLISQNPKPKIHQAIKVNYMKKN